MSRTQKEIVSSLSFLTDGSSLKDKNISQSNLTASPEIAVLLQTLDSLKVASVAPHRLQKTLAHLVHKVGLTIEELQGNGHNYFFAGPEWCRQNIDIAAQAHAKVIIDTYGTTYALPNKNPEANVQSLREGLDMYLTYKDNQPVGTACMVPVGNDMAELGRAASLGKVGNRVIQDLRIIDWLVNPKTAEKYHTIFATCRTAPDRDIGATEPMRGGQAVSHMWGEIPELIVGGFGPLYKKHGALETFAYSVLTREQINIPSHLWVFGGEDSAFIKAWCQNYGLRSPDIVNYDTSDAPTFGFHAEYPPLQSGVTQLVHGEIKLIPSSEPDDIEKSLSVLTEVAVPFIQVPVPLNQNTLILQKNLKERGFQAFIFTPGYGNRQPPQLWYGKPNGVAVVPRYWDIESGKSNPFWGKKLEEHGKRIANSW